MADPTAEQLRDSQVARGADGGKTPLPPPRTPGFIHRKEPFRWVSDGIGETAPEVKNTPDAAPPLDLPDPDPTVLEILTLPVGATSAILSAGLGQHLRVKVTLDTRDRLREEMRALHEMSERLEDPSALGEWLRLSQEFPESAKAVLGLKCCLERLRSWRQELPSSIWPEIESAARLGVAEAMFLMGYRRKSPEGAPPMPFLKRRTANTLSPEQWLRRAGLVMSRRGISTLATLYATGKGVSRNDEIARNLVASLEHRTSNVQL